ncbi:MAG: RNA polymerase subunit sigma-70, partial [Planctomycetes bacterium]|nr:RNA polymerase subunit sigma-70 [Planctomycetota bacterium]
MRRMLVDHARRRGASKRGGDLRRVPLLEIPDVESVPDEYLLKLDDALSELASLDAPLASVVELRFFGGLTIEETARLLEVSPMTVKRRWRVAKGWLHRRITERP